MADTLLSLIKFVVILQVIVQVVEPFGSEYKFGKNGLRKIYIEPEQKFNWFKANNDCIRRNMSLIAVDTAEKSAALDTILQKEFKVVPYLWIGAQDLGKEGEFIWTSTAKPLTFTNWMKGQPDNLHNKEHCVHVTHNREWNDITCEYKFGYICEN